MVRENMILFGASSPNLLSISDDHLVGKLTYLLAGNHPKPF